MMKLNKRFCFALLGVSLMIAGCGKAEENDSKSEPTAEPTKVAEATAKPAATAEPTATPNPEIVAPDFENGSTHKNPDGTEATPNPDAVMPDLSEMEEGCYISPDGTEIWKNDEDGSVEIVWSPYDVNLELPDEEDSSDYSIPTVITKDMQIMGIVDENGKVTEYLDSNDEDYIKVYEAVYGIELNELAVKDKSVRKTFEESNNYLTSDYAYTEQEILDEINKFGEKYEYNEKFNLFEFGKIYFNKNKSFCRVYYTKEVANDKSGSYICDGGEYGIYNLKKVSNKWFVCSVSNFPTELESMIPSN